MAGSTTTRKPADGDRESNDPTGADRNADIVLARP